MNNSMITAVTVILILLDMVTLLLLYREKSNRHAFVRVSAVITVLNLLFKAAFLITPGETFFLPFLSRKLVLATSAAVSIFLFGLFLVYRRAKTHLPLKSDMKISLKESGPEVFEKISPGRALVIETEHLYLIFPRYTDVRLAVGSDETEKDANITFYGSGPYKAGVFHNDIHSVIGPFVIDGEYYDTGLRAGEMKLGSFLWTENGFAFTEPGESEAVLRSVSGKRGSFGFSSNLYILNGKPRPFECTYTTVNCFRALGEYNGRLCIIDSKKPIQLDLFFEELIKAGLTNAIAMDMGVYSNYSWYLDSNGSRTRCYHKFFNKSPVVLIFENIQTTACSE